MIIKCFWISSWSNQIYYEWEELLRLAQWKQRLILFVRTIKILLGIYFTSKEVGRLIFSFISQPKDATCSYHQVSGVMSGLILKTFTLLEHEQVALESVSKDRFTSAQQVGPTHRIFATYGNDDICDKWTLNFLYIRPLNVLLTWAMILHQQGDWSLQKVL